MSQKKLSIIIPTFNRPLMLAECLNSFCGLLSFPHEIIIIDDGSTADGYQDINCIEGPIQFIRPGKIGAGAARNLGLEQAKGKYVKFLDDDDWLLPTGVDAQIRYLDARAGMDACYSGFGLLRDDRRVEFVGRAPGMAFEDQLVARFDGRWLIPPLAYMLRREVAKEVKWDTSLSSSQDTDYFSALMLEEKDFGWLPEIVGWARHDTNRERVSTKTSARKNDMVENQLKVLDRIRIKAAERGLLTNGLRRALANRYYKISLSAYETVAEKEKLRARLDAVSSIWPQFYYETKMFRLVAKLIGYTKALDLRRFKNRLLCKEN